MFIQNNNDSVFDNSKISPFAGEELSFEQEKSDTKKNFFDQELDCLFDQNPEEAIIVARKRINDFDSSLILKNATRTVKNKSLKIEIKIASLEKELAKMNEQIALLEMLNLDYDKKRLSELSITRDSVQSQMNDLKAEYKSMGLIYHISDFLNDSISFSKKFFKTKIAANIQRNLYLLFPSARKNSELNSEIIKLRMIQRKLAEKSRKKAVPQGEKESEMNNIVSFLNKAKQVDAKINKIINR